MQISKLRELLEPQLKEALPSDGDYLRGTTVDEAIQRRYGAQSSLTYKQKKAQVEQLVNDYKLYVGQRQVFYMLEERAGWHDQAVCA